MTRHFWSPESIALLRDLYPHNPTVGVLEGIFDRSARSIYAKANALGLLKSQAFLASNLAGRFDGKSSVKTRFQPGHQTWNKGKKGLQLGGERTRFQSGQMPHNTAEVGSYRFSPDGTLQRKIGTAKGSNSARWRGVHELVWIAANGPVPPKHIVVFRPGQKTTVLEEITLDRVECISLAENMRRNSYHNYPKEIARLIQLRGALVRKINHQEKTRRERNA